MRIIFNENKEVVKQITSALKANENFCPCRIEKTEDNRCMCKEFRDQQTTGFCHCQLYCKVD